MYQTQYNTKEFPFNLETVKATAREDHRKDSNRVTRIKLKRSYRTSRRWLSLITRCLESCNQPQQTVFRPNSSAGTYDTCMRGWLLLSRCGSSWSKCLPKVVGAQSGRSSLPSFVMWSVSQRSASSEQLIKTS